MNKYELLLVSYFIALLTACVGVDIVYPESITRVYNLMINSSIDSLKVGDEVQVSATVTNENNETVKDASIIWNSLNPEQASVTEEGIISGVATGPAIITAQYNELIDSISFYVGQTTVTTNSRSVNFSGRNGYAVNGTGTLSKEGSKLLLQFDGNFSADSGPGFVVYLSNNASSVQGGIELVALKANKGSQLYDIADILPQNGDNTFVDLNTFNYVIIYCKPFGVLFGVGAIQN